MIRPVAATLLALFSLALPPLAPHALAAADAAPSPGSPPLRVATLLPFVEDALQLAPDAAFALVATVRRDLRAPVASGLVDLGNPHSPGFEGIAEARARLVIGDRQIHGMLAPRLEALGVEVMLLDTTSSQSTLDALLEVGRRAGAGPALAAAVADARARLAHTRVGARRSVLALFGTPSRFYAATARSWLGGLVGDVGYENLAPSGSEQMPGFVVVSDEALAALRPDLVVIVAHGDPRKIQADVERRAGEGGAWASLREAALGIHVLDPRLFASQPGLRLPEAAAALVAYSEPRPAKTAAAHEGAASAASTGTGGR
jgi:iron complex transport system substrate-binding protein